MLRGYSVDCIVNILLYLLYILGFKHFKVNFSHRYIPSLLASACIFAYRLVGGNVYIWVRDTDLQYDLSSSVELSLSEIPLYSSFERKKAVIVLFAF